ncbi:cupin domain-containing protein [Embleya hyalina]|uniref:Cupin type-2 domain-containing protein n=1 Tax=Embleya hyalina TaxID=516124 RepID=A0A401YGQ1_9ACTN|nr:cupin domain-containing protein [Embleya hyalina]GCD93740.1 hypothetical protein EHYA_01388 [Embleya hyalina]
MRLLNDEHDAVDLRTTPVHLGLGSRAKPIEGFAWNPEVLRAYGAAAAADGAEGRMVMIFDGDGPGDHWERHPAGDELVVCLSGSVTVIRDMDGVRDHVRLRPGEATVNPAGAWHVVDMAGPTSILTITAGLGTDHHPRTDTHPSEHTGTPDADTR